MAKHRLLQVFKLCVALLALQQCLWLASAAPPSTTITTTVSSPTNWASIYVRVSFSEAVQGFTKDKVQLSAGSYIVADTFKEETSKDYGMSVTGPEGSIAVNVAQGAALSVSSSEPSTAAAELTITRDISAPQVTISIDTPPTDRSVQQVTITFSETVVGFHQGFVAVASSDSSLVAGSLAVVEAGRVFTVDVQPAAGGEVIVSVPANVVEDEAENLNNGGSFTLFHLGPAAVELSTSVQSPTNWASIYVLATASRALTGIEEADFVLGGGATMVAGSFEAHSSTAFSVSITGPEGSLTISLPEGAGVDDDSNPSQASNQLEVVRDVTGPTVTLSSSFDDSASGIDRSDLTITVTASFSESVTGFTEADIKTSSGSAVVAGSFELLTAHVYTVDIRAATSGVVSVEVEHSACTDLAQNANKIAKPLDFFHLGPPTVGLASAAGNPTNWANILVRIAFSKPVTGLELEDIHLDGNGLVSNLVKLSNDLYTVDVQADDGTFVVTVVSDAAVDALGQGNLASDPLAITRDSVPPTLTLSAGAGALVNNDASARGVVALTMTFSEDVSGVSEGDVLLSSHSRVIPDSLSQLSASKYTVMLLPASSGIVVVGFRATSGVQDSAGNALSATTDLQLFDDAPPVMTIDSPTTSPTNWARIYMTVEASEPITGFSESGLELSQGAAVITDSFRALSATSFSFNLVAPDGLVTVQVKAGAVRDASGNANEASATWVTLHDTQEPTVTITTSASPPLAAHELLPLRLEFTEPISGFEESELELPAGVAVVVGSFLEVTANEPEAPSVFTLTVRLGAELQVPEGGALVLVPKDAAQDAAANGNLASTPLRLTHNQVLSAAAGRGTMTALFVALLCSLVAVLWQGVGL